MEFLVRLLNSTDIQHLEGPGIDFRVEESNGFHWVVEAIGLKKIARRVPKEEDFGCPDDMAGEIIDDLKAGLASFREVVVQSHARKH